MKWMRNLIIIVVILAIVFVGIGIASGASLSNIFDAITSSDEFVLQDPIVYEGENLITSVVINVETRDIVLETSDTAEITINHYRVEGEIWDIHLTDSVLTITQEDEPGFGGWFNWSFSGDKNDIVIAIPNDIALTNDFDLSVTTNTGTIEVNGYTALLDVHLETDTGRITIEDMDAEMLNATSDTGSINIQDTMVEQEAVIETNTGSVTLDTVSSTFFDIEVNTGSITMTDCTFDQVDLMADTGSININGFPGLSLSSYSLHLSTDTGSISVDGLNQGHTFNLVVSGGYYINADTDTGSIHIND